MPVVARYFGGPSGSATGGKGKGKGRAGNGQETDFRLGLRAYENGYGAQGKHKFEVSVETKDNSEEELRLVFASRLRSFLRKRQKRRLRCTRSIKSQSIKIGPDQSRCAGSSVSYATVRS